MEHLYYFNITDIEHGWLTLHINKLSFRISYITDVKEEFDKVIKFIKEDQDISFPTITLYFDGEGRDLYLTIRKEYNQLSIIWEQDDKKEKDTFIIFYIHQVNFIKIWEDIWSKIEKDYNTNFIFTNKGWC